MYDWLSKSKNRTDENLGPDAVSHHRGSHRDFLKRCESVATTAVKAGRKGVKTIVPYLFGWIADARTLRCAWDHLAKTGGQAPGPNGHLYRELAGQEVWALCRSLAKAIRDGTYQPGKERVRWISKGPGRGDRPLVLQNIEDRVVQRAVAIIVGPIVEERFDERSLGFRKDKDRLDALALAERIVTQQQRWVWVCEDIRDAFLNVPLPRLLQVVKKQLPDEKVVGLIERLLANASTPGLRQGSPLSPLLLNVYLNSVLDRVWRKRHPDVPLLRVADDLLLLCRTWEEAKQAHATLASLLESAGCSAKLGFEQATRNLSAQERADWLGFHVGRDGQELTVGIADKAWGRLEEKLARAHEEPDAPLRADDVIRGWLAQLGPCYPHVDVDEACGRVRSIAQGLAFDETPSPTELKQHWQKAYARWCKLRKAASGAAPS